MSKKKKGAATEEKILLGRPGNNVSMGIVGMPNVGKSLMFNVLSGLSVASANFAFCTIDPNVAKVPVKDTRFDDLVAHHKPKSVVPAVLTITDIAGLVKGAADGAGLGNAFLSHIAAVDGIFHLVRAFKKKSVEHVEGSVDPARDLEIISQELIIKDVARAKAEQEKMTKALRNKKPSKKQQDDIESINKVVAHLEAGKDIREGAWNNNDVALLNTMNLLSAKPVVYLVNVSEKNWLTGKNKWLGDIKEWCKKRSPGAPVIPFSAVFESKLADLEDEEKRKTFLDEQKSRSMVDKIVHAGYQGLSLIHFFTSGADEVRAWTLRKGSKAPQAAGVIHTDFERGFICADTMAFDDWKKCGNDKATKDAGLLKQQGKGYVVSDGDIMHFKFNVTK